MFSGGLWLLLQMICTFFSINDSPTIFQLHDLRHSYTLTMRSCYAPPLPSVASLRLVPFPSAEPSRRYSLRIWLCLTTNYFIRNKESVHHPFGKRQFHKQNFVFVQMIMPTSYSYSLFIFITNCTYFKRINFSQFSSSSLWKLKTSFYKKCDLKVKKKKKKKL